MSNKSIEVELIDASDGVTVHSVEITIDKHGIEIRPVGCGTFTMMDGSSGPIYFEVHENTPKLYVWDDINEEEPSHVISLEGSRESLRKDSFD